MTTKTRASRTSVELGLEAREVVASSKVATTVATPTAAAGTGGGGGEVGSEGRMMWGCLCCCA